MTKKSVIQIQLITALLVIVFMVMLSACGKEPRKPQGRLDTPAHHTTRGNDFLEKGAIEKAGDSFDKALSLNKDYSPALAGMAVVKAHAAEEAGFDKGKREDISNEATSLLANAISKSENDDEKRVAHIAGIQVYQMTKVPDDWLDDAEEHYEDAVGLDERQVDPDPHLFMARAYRDAFAIQKSQDLYRKVLGMRSHRSREANNELALLQKIIRAEPGTRYGKEIAFAPDISRADFAALLIEELRLDSLYERSNAKRFDKSFKPPTQSGSNTTFQTDTMKQVPVATDIKDHPLKADIEEVLRLRVVGLEPDPSHKFHPDEKVNRAEFAMIVEDILVKVTGETKLKTRFIGQKSPFPDVRSDVPYFNAVQTVTSRNLMAPENKVKGIFGPSEPVSGADSLLALRLLKDELSSFLRP